MQPAAPADTEAPSTHWPHTPCTHTMHPPTGPTHTLHTHPCTPPPRPQVICTKVRDGDKRIVRLKEGTARGRHVVIVDDLVQSGGWVAGRAAVTGGGAWYVAAGCREVAHAGANVGPFAGPGPAPQLLRCSQQWV